jgi:putative endonuclease
MKDFYVYIMANRARTLYTGMTNSLAYRVWQHKHMEIDGFTRRYLIDRLVYYEIAPDAASAIQREKQIKGWVRRKKVALIESVNSEWRDLSGDFLDIRPTLADSQAYFRKRGRRDSSLSKASVPREASPREPSNGC